MQMQSRMTGRARVAVFAALALGAATAASCGDDDADDPGEVVDTITTEVEEGISEVLDDATETAIRNLATEHGEAQFDEAGEPLDDDGLTCEAAVADGLDAVDVECTGTTEGGAGAELTGTTSELPGASVTELEGEFTGTVDGDEVFSVDQLGG